MQTIIGWILCFVSISYCKTNTAFPRRDNDELTIDKCFIKRNSEDEVLSRNGVQSFFDSHSENTDTLRREESAPYSPFADGSSKTIDNQSLLVEVAGQTVGAEIENDIPTLEKFQHLVSRTPQTRSWPNYDFNNNLNPSTVPRSPRRLGPSFAPSMEQGSFLPSFGQNSNSRNVPPGEIIGEEKTPLGDETYYKDENGRIYSLNELNERVPAPDDIVTLLKDQPNDAEFTVKRVRKKVQQKVPVEPSALDQGPTSTKNNWSRQSTPGKLLRSPPQTPRPLFQNPRPQPQNPRPQDSFQDFAPGSPITSPRKSAFQPRTFDSPTRSAGSVSPSPSRSPSPRKSASAPRMSALQPKKSASSPKRAASPIKQSSPSKSRKSSPSRQTRDPEDDDDDGEEEEEGEENDSGEGESEDEDEGDEEDEDDEEPTPPKKVVVRRQVR